MKTSGIALAAASLLAASAGIASAACDFDIAKAKGVKGSMVRNYAPCPGTENPTENTSTEGGTEACTPVTPREVSGQSTAYSYSDKGGCQVQTKAKLLASCQDLNPALEAKPCHVTFVKGKCKGILGTDGLTPIGPGDTGWSLATLSRATLADETNGDMTVIDFPVTFLFGDPKKGSIKLKSDSTAALAPLVGPANADLPPCTSIEIVDLTIKDPLGLPFAKLGGATVP